MSASERDSAPAPDVTELSVRLGGRRVGTLAATAGGEVAFEYDGGWLASGFSISPLSLPLRRGVFVAKADPFDGLFGVFQDSMPDGWGALLLDRKLRARGIDPRDVSPLSRLAIVGSGGRGALRYEPEVVLGGDFACDDLDRLARACGRIMDDEETDDLDAAFRLGGSSAGARPKAYLRIDGASWLVKFPSSIDPKGIGEREYAYALCARECGVEMPRTRLFPSKTCGGYFGTERFDRDASGNGIHMVSASGLLEVSHRTPVLDYAHLFRLTARLTGDASQLWALYRLMCFNVFAHNQDDHSNNFSWLCEEGAWRLSPAYDLTYSTSFGNEHATTVNGLGRPTLQDVVGVGVAAGLKEGRARAVAREIEDACRGLLEMG